MELFLSRRSLLDSRVVEGGHKLADRRSALDLAGVPERMPFVLGDDGSYDLRLNQFLRELPTMGVPAEKSWLAYARDVVTWARFLAEQRGKTVWEAEQADVAAYHRVRRLSPPETAISSSTWDRGIATLDKFYRWATANGHVHRPPFSYRAPRSSAFLPGRRQPEPVNLAKERRGRRRPPGFVSVEDYLVFRDVGLRGRLPDGGPDPSFRGRHGHRNALFAELLVTTGMRLGEAGTLLMAELPASGGGKSVPLPLAPVVCKGGRGRTVRVPARVLAAIGGYTELERQNALEGRYPQTADEGPEVVAIDGRACAVMVDGRRFRVPLARMTPAHRMAAVAGDRCPLALWLTEAGTPVSDRAWEAVFHRGSARCRALGHPVEVSPHTLRHTFAVHMLSLLIREQIGSLERPGGADAATAPYRRLLGDPLQRLQRLLGHRSVVTTYVYLDSLAEAQWLVDDAVDRWAREICPEAGDSVA
ncbi:MAG TPA: site-specific integrase [Acidimicrobiales bacterium]|nr:site-specific integrase [Acidimicrobiales bacterium]